MMNHTFHTNQNCPGDRHGVLPSPHTAGLDDYMRSRAERQPTDWTAPRHFFADGSMDGSSVSSFAHSTYRQPVSQLSRPPEPLSLNNNRNEPEDPVWQAPRHLYDNSVDGSSLASFALGRHSISQFHVTPEPPSPMGAPDTSFSNNVIPPATPTWQAPRHLFDNSVDKSSVASFATDRHQLSQFQPLPTSSINRPPTTSNDQNVPQIPAWQAPRHLFDDDSDDESLIAELSARGQFGHPRPTNCQRPSAVNVSGQNAAAAISSSAQLVHSNTDTSEVNTDVRGNPAFVGGERGDFGNSTRDDDLADLVPCFGNAVVLQEEDYNPYDPRNSRPFITAKDPTVTNQSLQSGEEAPQRNRITVVPRVADLNFASIVEKEEKEGKIPMTDLERFKRMYPVRGGMPKEPATGKAYYWKTLPCQYRRYPWIADIFKLYRSQSQNQHVKKEGESRGLIIPVEHYHSGNYDYAKCWIFNTEFHQKMMIIPYWCFPRSLPRLGVLYEVELRLVLARLGGRVRPTMRIKFGSMVKEAEHQNEHYLGVSTEIMESPDSWCKVLSIHCRLIQNSNMSLFAREFQEVIYDKSQIKEFPKGAHFVEGNGFIQPLPGIKGTLPIYTKDEPCFYLIREFRQSAVEFDQPRVTAFTPEEVREWARQEQKEKEKTRYEWQPRGEHSVTHARRKKTLGDKPPLRLSSAGNLSKSERVLLTIEILRRIRERSSEFLPLCPDNVYALECVVGDREVPSKSKRLRDVTERLHKMICAEGPYNWIKKNEPATMKDLFEIIKMNVNYLPKCRDSVAAWLRPIMFPENEESDYEEWD